MKKTKNHGGYERVLFYVDGKSRHYRVHRLVWEAFRGPIPDGYEIDHINTVRDDNRLVNLRCVTPKENQNNPVTMKRHRDAGNRRSKDPQWCNSVRDANRQRCAKPVLQLDKDTGEVIREWKCVNDAALVLGISQGSISYCCHGKRNTTGGFKWKFA